MYAHMCCVIYSFDNTLLRWTENEFFFLCICCCAVEHHSTQYFDMLSIIVGYFLPFGICIVVRYVEFLIWNYISGTRVIGVKRRKRNHFELDFIFIFVWLSFSVE